MNDKDAHPKFRLRGTLVKADVVAVFETTADVELKTTVIEDDELEDGIVGDDMIVVAAHPELVHTVSTKTTRAEGRL